MDGNAKLTKTTLAKSLSSVCALLAQYLEHQTGEITPSQIAALPDYVFEVAVWAGWLPEPYPYHRPPPLKDQGPENVALGSYDVHCSFREEFVALIQETLDELEPWNAEIARQQEEEYRKARQEEFRTEVHIDELRAAAEEYHSLFPDADAGEGQSQEPQPSTQDFMEIWLHEHDHTMESLAALAGVDVLTLNRIKHGKFAYTRRPRSLKKVAAAMKCDPRKLLRVRSK